MKTMRSLVAALTIVLIVLLASLTAYAVTTGTQTTPGWPIENASSNEVVNSASGSAALVDFTQGPNQKVVLTANSTLTFTVPTYPGSCRIKLVQDSTGSRTVTWPASVKWPSGTAPTLTTTASHTDIVNLYFDGTNFYGTSSLDVR